MTTQNAQTTPGQINGVDVDEVMSLIGRIDQDADLGRCQFRARNSWLRGGLNHSRIQGFHALGDEDSSRFQPFELEADEPAFLAGDDSAPNPVEFVLHALAGCLTTTTTYHAAVQGIVIEAIDSSLEGDLDLRGIFGLSDEVRKGFNEVRVRMRIKSSASVDELRALAMFSPVFDIVSNSLPVKLVIEKV
ncbi:MAG: OsmC family protein [Gammaproteobacteria bacterium]